MKIPLRLHYLDIDDMELLIIRHAEVQTTNGIIATHDGPLTDNGVKQSVLSAAWIDYNFRLKGFQGFVSPYFGALQTASLIANATGINFHVRSALRDFSFEEKEGGIEIANRSLMFSNLDWPIDSWHDEKVIFSEETIDELIDRNIGFLKFLSSTGYDKVMVVTHVTPGIILSELALDKSRDQIKTSCEEALKSVREPSRIPIMIGPKHMLLTGMVHCGITWIVDKEQHWFNKIVYAG
jgi:broad specificity phosphatase PhoE